LAVFSFARYLAIPAEGLITFFKEFFDTTAIDMINNLIVAEAGHSLLKNLHYYQSPELIPPPLKKVFLNKTEFLISG
jgi:hypothetical protein